MMQTSSPSPVLTALLEVASITAEVLEARDLLRLHTPIMKSVVTVQWLKTTAVETAKVLKRMGNSSVGVIEDGAEQVEGGEQAQDESGQGGDGDEDGEGGEKELRRQFCGHTLITTQIGV